jgi:hypothetical protein
MATLFLGQILDHNVNLKAHLEDAFNLCNEKQNRGTFVVM